MLDKLTRGDFAKHLNQTFHLPAKPGDLELELIEAEALPGAEPAPEGQRQGFSLIFRGPMDAVLDQGTYPLEHPEMGNLELFLVPIGPDAHGLCYQSIFN